MGEFPKQFFLPGINRQGIFYFLNCFVIDKWELYIENITK
jgi:hypothetical protein